MSDEEYIVGKLQAWRRDPVLAVRDLFGVEPDEWQADVLREFAVSNNILMQACKGPGKSCLMAWIGWIFLLTRPHCNVMCLSVTGDNLKDGLWKELAHWQKKSPLLSQMFTWTKTRITSNEHPETWWASARSYAKNSDPGAQAKEIAGLHAEYIMALVDEAGGIPMAVMAAVEAVQSTGKEAKVVAAGNPTNLDGYALYECSKSKKWKRFEITGDPDDPKRSPRISKEWAQEQIDRWGRDSPWVMVNVLGKFPSSALNQLITHDEVEAAMRRQPGDVSMSQKRVGVDVARFGGDMSVICMRQGLACHKMIEMRDLRTTEVAARVIGVRHEWGTDVEYVDDTGGYGAGVIDTMIAQGYSPQGVGFAQRANDPDRYYNKRAEMWHRMAEWIRRGGCLQNDAELKRELTSVQYTFQGSKMLLEDKGQVKTRLGFSPDKADALALTFAYPETPRGLIMSPEQWRAEQRKAQIRIEYDPLGEDRW